MAFEQMQLAPPELAGQIAGQDVAPDSFHRQIQELTPGNAPPAAPHQRPAHKWHDPAGRSQGRKDVQLFKQATNKEFVDHIEHECVVGPHLEWGIAATAVAAKASLKGWILGQAGDLVGPAGRVLGYGTGIGIGLVSGIYSAYETAELLEGSARATAYEGRLRQNMGGTLTAPTGGMDPFSQMYDVERGVPGVRDVVDGSKRKIDDLRGKPFVDPRSEFTKLALGQSALDDSSFISWAQKEAQSTSRKSALGHYLVFAALGAAGGLFTARKLHLSLQGNLVAGAVGATFGLGLSYLGVKAKQEEALSELYRARLMEHPDERPLF